MLVYIDEFISDIYTRLYFKNLIGTTARDIHQRELTTPMGSLSNDHYWLHWTEKSNTKNCPILYRTSTVKDVRSTKDLDTYVKQHLVSSVIRNILLNNSYSEMMRGNIAVFIFYYHAYYNSKEEYNLNELTEKVIIHLSNTITTMMNKELTTYRNYKVNSLIKMMRTRLNIERSYITVKRINLRT